MESVNIPYLELQLYLMTILEKDNPNFTIQELSTIEEIYLNPIGINNIYNKIDFNILKYFPNLKRLEITNSNITSSVISLIVRLTKLESISFNNCHISSIKEFYQTKFKSLSINKCTVIDLENISLLKHLNSVKLINMKLGSIEYLENLPHLTEVDLSYSTIDNNSTLYTFILIEKLKIHGSNITDLDFVNKYSGIKEISIDRKQYQNNKDLIDDLVALGIMVYEDDCICYNNIGGKYE